MFQLRTWLKLPILLDGQLQLQPVASSVPTLLSSTFHLLLATDAEQRGESDRAQAHKVLAEVETTAVTAPQLWLGRGCRWWFEGVYRYGIDTEHLFFMLKHVETNVQH